MSEQSFLWVHCFHKAACRHGNVTRNIE
jgi:hypothetical protein